LRFFEAFQIIGDEVPGIAAGLDDGVVIEPDLTREEAFTQIEPEPFDRVAFWGIGRQGQQGEIGWDDQALAAMPAGAVEQHHDMLVGLQDYIVIAQAILSSGLLPSLRFQARYSIL